MDYTVALNLHKLPGAFVKKILVNGVEQPCLCIPQDPAVFHKTKTGWNFIQVTLREREEILGTDSHVVYYSYPDPNKIGEEIKKIKCGKCKISQPFDMNKDRTNNSTYIGYGTICIDDIPEEAINTNSFTGKRYVKIMIKPLTELDRGENTGIIAINPHFGADNGRRESLANGFDAPLVEIGRIKEMDESEGMKTGNLLEYKPTDDTQTEESDSNESEREIDGLIF